MYLIYWSIWSCLKHRKPYGGMEGWAWRRLRDGTDGRGEEREGELYSLLVSSARTGGAHGLFIITSGIVNQKSPKRKNISVKKHTCWKRKKLYVTRIAISICKLNVIFWVCVNWAILLTLFVIWTDGPLILWLWEDWSGPIVAQLT